MNIWKSPMLRGMIVCLVFCSLTTAKVKSDSNVCLPDSVMSYNDRCKLEPVLLLRNYEPTTVGLTWDDDEGGYPFLDFKISLMYPLLPSQIGKDAKTPIYLAFTRLYNPLLKHVSPYFGFTTQMGQYIGTRPSSPVISKRFNPTLFLRWNANKSIPNIIEYLDGEYGHESNGQYVTTDSILNLQSLEHGSREAKDFISRGWDYLGTTLKHTGHFRGVSEYSVHLNGRYFLDRGILQGGKEEYQSWENDSDGAPRSKFHGLKLMSKFEWETDNKDWFTHQKLAGIVETGYKPLFEKFTLRGELSSTIFGSLPFTIWYSKGYGNDLAMYYKEGWSSGLSLELLTLLR